MSGYPFEKVYRIRWADTGGHKKTLGIEALMGYFEEMALLQSESRGVGFDYYARHSVIWMMHAFDIRIHQWPCFNQQVLLRTTPHSVYRFMGSRRFALFPLAAEQPGAGLFDEKPIIEADTIWLFVDTRARRPIRVSHDMKQAYGHLDAEEQRPELPLVPRPENPEKLARFEVRRSDIDVNQHVNHIRYVNWALETLPAEIIAAYRLVQISGLFSKETLFGDTVQLTSQFQDPDEPGIRQCLHLIQDSSGEEKSRLMTRWAPL